MALPTFERFIARAEFQKVKFVAYIQRLTRKGEGSYDVVSNQLHVKPRPDVFAPFAGWRAPYEVRSIHSCVLVGTWLIEKVQTATSRMGVRLRI